MIKMIKLAVVILAIFGMVLNINGVSFAQDDDGGGGGGGDGGGDYGGDIGDSSDTGDSGDSGDAGDIDERGRDTADYQEEAAVETQYEEPVAPAPVTTSTTTNVTNVYTRGGYVYDRGRSDIVGAAVVGAVVGAAAVNAAAGTGNSVAVVEKTTKRPVVIKKRPPTSTTTQAVQAVEATQTKNKEGKK